MKYMILLIVAHIGAIAWAAPTELTPIISESCKTTAPGSNQPSGQATGIKCSMSENGAVLKANLKFDRFGRICADVVSFDNTLSFSVDIARAFKEDSNITIQSYPSSAGSENRQVVIANAGQHAAPTQLVGGKYYSFEYSHAGANGRLECEVF